MKISSSTLKASICPGGSIYTSETSKCCESGLSPTSESWLLNINWQELWRRYVHKETCTWMLLVTRFMVARNWKQLKCQSAGGWGGMDEQMVVRPYSEIQLSDKKERTINTQNLDDSWRHYAEWKHPGSKGYILCSCIYMKFYRRQNYSDRKQISSSSRG